MISTGWKNTYLWPQAENIIFKGVVDGFQVDNLYLFRSRKPVWFQNTSCCSDEIKKLQKHLLSLILAKGITYTDLR